ncbi:MAG: polyhydroxyalkanoate synthesis regulator DNA-binding domain-containing protein [Desulfobacterales bacterium]
MAEAILLKKYTNRRLYDTEKSRYVTLEQVADMVKSGRQVEIVDAKTKEDVTAFILTQIVLEEAKKKNILLPVPVLHLIIQYGNNILSEFFENYLQKTIQNYLEYKKAFDNQIQKWLDLGTDLSRMMPKATGDPSSFGDFMKMFNNPLGNKPEKPVSDGRSHPSDISDEDEKKG